MATSALRRLPGVRFETVTPPLRDPLPRMDVAAFAGFASAGPVGLPVRIDDEGALGELFGPDLPLAWDRDRGAPVWAHLAPAVRSFLRNGGRSAYVLRLARRAHSDAFPVPGLVRRRASGDLSQASALARSEGSWADEVSVTAIAWSRPVAFVSAGTDDDGSEWIAVEVEAPGDVVAGDLLRFAYADGHVLMFFVEDVEQVLPAAPGSPPDGARRIRLKLRASARDWFRLPTTPAVPTGDAELRTLRGATEHATALLPATTVPGAASWPGDGTVVVQLDLPFASAPAAGSLVRLDFGAERIFFTVEDTVAEERLDSPPGSVLTVRGHGLAVAAEPPGWMALAPAGERMTFELWARHASGLELRLGGLGFHPAHARFWGALPTDAELFGPPLRIPTADEAKIAAERAPLVEEASHPRFPLSGDGREDRFLPIGMPFLPGAFQAALHPDLAAIERNGLSSFDSGLFLDPDLLDVETSALLGEADFIRFTGPHPRLLTGMHAVLGLEEATLLAVPDAVHRGWTGLDEAPLPPPHPSPPLDRRRDWPCCDRPLSEVAERPRLGPGDFHGCLERVLAAPVLSLIESADPGTYALTWSLTEVLHAPRFVLEEASRPDFSNAAEVPAGSGGRVDFYGRRAGDYYYRARVFSGGNDSDWSPGVAHRVPAEADALLSPASAFDDQTLLDVHRALLRLCAARGDLFAVLALPEHYDGADAASHARTLSFRGGPLPPSGPVPPLGGGEERALGYAALFHPWVIGREAVEASPLRRQPPDGAVTGVMARRALARGAWVAPANERLRGVLDLAWRTDAGGRRRLYDAQVNLLLQEPEGFLTLSADTLHPDDDLRPINVRRLLQLLRRLALRDGQAYVFEPNDARFRRIVQRGFETVLGYMFDRGAFAGATQAASFQVVTGEEVNPPGSVDAGRFFVELKVAPSRPLAFLTVRLVQTGDRRLLAEER
jgi:hypothetical protein